MIDIDEMTALQAALAAELAEGQKLSNSHFDALVAQREELGLPLICTADELYSTPMPEGYSEYDTTV